MSPPQITNVETSHEPHVIPTEPSSSSIRRWDRDWLRQLLLKHAHNHPNMPQDLREKALVVVRFFFVDCLLYVYYTGVFDLVVSMV